MKQDERIIDYQLEPGMFIVIRGPYMKGLNPNKAAELVDVRTYHEDGMVSLKFDGDENVYEVDLRKRFDNGSATFHGHVKPVVCDTYSERVKYEDEKRKSEDAMLRPAKNLLHDNSAIDDDGYQHQEVIIQQIIMTTFFFLLFLHININLLCLSLLISFLE